ncbi:MAG TPA: indolepyruvate oxidoreductase subunit beta [Dissulfurispiraceae bacterium]|nr:indolepyruvate oxidoreductase subunit beta [Dissulfurispiraceae bacterium]
MGITSVLFAGVGGQGIILASTVLAKCAFNLGLMVKQSELHGMAQRGGSVISHVRFGKEVYSPLIPKGRADYLVALEELEGLRYNFYLKPGGTIILNKKRVVPPTADPVKNPYPEDVKEQLGMSQFKIVEMDALEIAKNVGNPKVENVIIIGALSTYMEDFPLDAWEQAVRESVPPKTVEINIRAFREGRRFTSKK